MKVIRRPDFRAMPWKNGGGTTYEIIGEPPSPVNPPSGCRFHPRCPAADDVCVSTEPIIRQVGEGHFVACHHPLVTPVEIS